MSDQTKLLTTGIGSLPHHNIDSALAYSLKFDIPFLPQIPIRNPWEYMVASALEGLPGLMVEKEGLAFLNVEVWEGRSKSFNDRLSYAFSHSADPNAFESFEPSSATSSSWQPFLWELQEQKKTTAKIQLCGPLTAQWALRLSDGKTVDHYPDLGAQIFKIVLARAIAMGRRLLQQKIKPILFLDEPGLYGLSPENPKHAISVSELSIVISALKKEGITVGLHCCSNSDWAKILPLGMDYLSIDTHLSLESLMKAGPALKTYLNSGGKLSLGVVPTDIASEQQETPKDLTTGLIKALGQSPDPSLKNQILASSLLTPACGMALLTPEMTEEILSNLLNLKRNILMQST